MSLIWHMPRYEPEAAEVSSRPQSCAQETVLCPIFGSIQRIHPQNPKPLKLRISGLSGVRRGSQRLGIIFYTHFGYLLRIGFPAHGILLLDT